MSARETQGRVRVHVTPICGEVQIVPEVGSADWPVVTLGAKEPDARRLVSCWNACDGLDTEAIEGLAEVGGVTCLAVDSRNYMRERDQLRAALERSAKQADRDQATISMMLDQAGWTLKEIGQARTERDAARALLDEVADLGHNAVETSHGVGHPSDEFRDVCARIRALLKDGPAPSSDDATILKHPPGRERA